MKTNVTEWTAIAKINTITTATVTTATAAVAATTMTEVPNKEKLTIPLFIEHANGILDFWLMLEICRIKPANI